VVSDRFPVQQPPRQQPYKFLPGAITLAFVAAFAVVMLIITMATHQGDFDAVARRTPFA
jgi:hypothetical protein